MPAGIDELERPMLKGFGESEKENDRSGLAAKAADVGAADLKPVGLIGAAIGRRYCTIAVFPIEMHFVVCSRHTASLLLKAQRQISPIWQRERVTVSLD